MRHHLLDQLAADGIAEEGGAEETVGQAGDKRSGHLASDARPALRQEVANGCGASALSSGLPAIPAQTFLPECQAPLLGAARVVTYSL